MLNKSAFIFPGQGAQYVGMGRELHDNSAAARDIFEQANNILGFDIKRFCFEGPSEELTRTENCQPAILTASIAALVVLKEKNININVTHTAGLSLGEYTALVASDSLTFKDAIKLVRLRGKFMEQASQTNPGKMLCIIGLAIQDVESVCKATGAEIANLNCPGQVVVSSAIQDVDKVQAQALAKGAKKVIVLDVSGPFHSALMNSASVNLKKELDLAGLNPPKIEFVANVTAGPLKNPQDIKDALIRQVSNTTYWEKSICYMRDSGVKVFYEIGPGKVLKGLLRRIDANLEVINIENLKDIEQAIIRNS